MKQIVLMLTLLGATSLAQTPSVQRQKPTANDVAIDERAKAALVRMSNYLKTLKEFKINSESAKDEIVDTDMKIEKNAANERLIRLPDRLHARVKSDDRDLQFFYDGQTMTVFSPKENYYASTPAPPTVSRTLDAVQVRLGITMPLTDFIHMAAAENLLQDITRAGYIGTSQIEGVETEHIAVRQPEVDWQVWIEKSDTPLPRRIVITTKKQPTQPQYRATLTWDTSPTIDEELFAFTPPPDAVRIKFARAKGGQQTPAKR